MLIEPYEIYIGNICIQLEKNILTDIELNINIKDSINFIIRKCKNK